MKKLKILVAGNEFMNEDNIHLRVLPKLEDEFKEIDFVRIEGCEDLTKLGNTLLILDSASGINKVEIIEDLDKIKIDKRYSLHDFDLAFNLKLLKKLNLIDKVRIIAVPNKLDEKAAFFQLQYTLRKCVAQLMQGS